MKTRKLVFKKGNQQRNNNKVGVKRTNFIKGFALNYDEADELSDIDLLVETVVSSKKGKPNKRSRYTSISVEEWEAILERLAISDYESEMDEVNDTYLFIDEDGERISIPQSKLHGVEIDGLPLSRTREMGVYSHVFVGIENALYERNEENAEFSGQLGVNGEYFTNSGVRCVFAVIDGELVLEPIYIEYSVNMTDEVIDGKPIADTTMTECIDFWNSVNEYGVEFKYNSKGLMNPEDLQSIYEANQLHCPTLDRALNGSDGEGLGAIEFDYKEFDFEAAYNGSNEDNEDEESDEQPNPQIAQIQALTTKKQLKDYAKDNSIQVAFKTSHSVEEMKALLLEAVNVPF